MAIRAGATLARLPSRVGVDAEFEALGVHVVGERLDAVGEARGIRHESSLRVTYHLPAVVDHDVPIPSVAHAARDHGVGGFADQPVRDVAPEVVPAVPAHRRGTGGGPPPRGAGGAGARGPDGPGGGGAAPPHPPAKPPPPTS